MASMNPELNGDENGQRAANWAATRDNTELPSIRQIFGCNPHEIKGRPVPSLYEIQNCRPRDVNFTMYAAIKDHIPSDPDRWAYYYRRHNEGMEMYQIYDRDVMNITAHCTPESIAAWNQQAPIPNTRQAHHVVPPRDLSTLKSEAFTESFREEYRGTASASDSLPIMQPATSDEVGSWESREPQRTAPARQEQHIAYFDGDYSVSGVQHDEHVARRFEEPVRTNGSQYSRSIQTPYEYAQDGSVQGPMRVHLRSSYASQAATQPRYDDREGYIPPERPIHEEYAGISAFRAGLMVPENGVEASRSDARDLHMQPEIQSQRERNGSLSSHTVTSQSPTTPDFEKTFFTPIDWQVGGPRRR